MPARPPSGTVTFLFTDMEGSTRQLLRLGEGYATFLATQRELLRAAFQEFQGYEIDTQGDAFFVAFERAADAVRAAVMAQRALAGHPWPEGEAARIRMGLHTGEPSLSEAGYVGIDVHFAARLCAAGHGGQILLSPSTRDLVERDLPEGIRVRDLGEHRLRDLQQPRHIFQLVIAGLPEDFPPIKSLDALPNNLPIQLTSFIGREHEMAEVKNLLTGTRLLTLTGVGGTGKTRLALQIAADLLESYPDGVWFAELALLREPALVPQVVATALGLREQPGQPILNTLLDYAHSKRMLLVLDNCEHLIEACAQLADRIVRAGPEMRVLATSREPLAIAGETVLSVPALSLPASGETTALASLAQCEAAQLFIDRAARVSPGFTATAKNASAIAQICQRLDGIPLAIELAAARVKLLRIETLAARLDDRFNLLTTGGRTALPRHQTLRAAIDWSYDLLPEDTRILFRRVSVFAGGFTLGAAEAVCADEILARQALLDLLARLVDHSLVTVDQRGEEERYRLLETIREYAREKMADSGEGDLVQDRHLEYMLRLAETAEPHLAGPEQAAWLNRLEMEHDNLRTALDWSRTAQAKAARGLRLAGALILFWDTRGYFQEGREHLMAALEQNVSGNSIERARGLYGAGDLTLMQGDYAAARSLLDSSISIYRELGPATRRGLANSLLLRGYMESEVGEYSAASALLLQGLGLMRELNDRPGMARALHELGTCALRGGDHAQALRYLEEALPLLRQTGNRQDRAIALTGLAEIALRQADYERAASLEQESLNLRREIGDKWGIAVSLANFAWASLRRGDPEQAAALLAESLALRQEIGDRGGIAWCMEKLAEVAMTKAQDEQSARRNEDWEWAARLFGAADGLRASIGSTIDLVDRPAYERQLSALRTQLDRLTFDREWAEGHAIILQPDMAEGLAQFIEYARHIRETPRAGATRPSTGLVQRE